MLRSLNPIPSSPSLRSSDGISDCSAWASKVYSSWVPSSLRASGQPASARRQRRHRLLQVQGQLPLAQLLHQLGLLLEEDQLALGDDADAIGHLLRFIDVVGRQDDGHAAGAQAAHQGPHLAPQLDVDAGGRLVKEQDLGLVRQRLGDHHPALHAAGEGHHLVVALVPQRQIAQHPLDVGRVGRAPEQAAAELTRRPDALERVGGQLLRDQADLEPRLAVVAQDVVAVDPHRAPRRGDDAADDADERGLAGAVGAEQREDLALADLEVDRLQRHQPRRIGLGQLLDGDDGRYLRRHGAKIYQARAPAAGRSEAPSVTRSGSCRRCRSRRSPAPSGSST